VLVTLTVCWQNVSLHAKRGKPVNQPSDRRSQAVPIVAVTPTHTTQRLFRTVELDSTQQLDLQYGSIWQLHYINNEAITVEMGKTREN
jgi:hypothetical protein